MSRPLRSLELSRAARIRRLLLPPPSEANENNASAPAQFKDPIVVTQEQLCVSPLPQDVEPPYHIYPRWQKWGFATLVSLAGCFSPLSTNLYVPVLSIISDDLHVTETLIGLTITVYMVVEGITPLPLGAIADATGRRLVLAVTLILYVVANLALSFTTSYAMLLVLRGLQAAGSAAAVSIGVGVISDLASPNERASFMALHAGARMTGQAVGPVIGGALDDEWGFKSIFWLLFAFSAPVAFALVFFLPETHRRIAGNGSVPLTGFHKPLAYMIRPPKEWEHAPKTPAPRMPPLTLAKMAAPVARILERDIFVLVSWGAIVFTAWSTVTSSTTTSLLLEFPYLSRWQLGLCFLPNGLGCMTGSLCSGMVLDRTFARVERGFKERNRVSRVDVKGHRDFPFEAARLPLLPYMSAVLIVALAVYGPSFRASELDMPHGADLAAPLGLQFIIAFASSSVFEIYSTLLVDYFPDGSAGASATNNLCRCLLGAAGEGLIQPLIDAVETTHAFLIMAGLVLLFSPLVWVEMKWGEKWRLEREQREGQSNISWSSD